MSRTNYKNIDSYLIQTWEGENESLIFLKQYWTLVYTSGFHLSVILHPPPPGYQAMSGDISGSEGRIVSLASNK